MLYKRGLHVQLQAAGPKWKSIIYLVDKHFGKIEKLGNEFLDVRRVPLTIAPRLGDRMEQSVGMIKLATLKTGWERENGKHVLPHSNKGYVDQIRLIRSD